METKASEAKVVDEVCTDSEYESRTPEDPNAKPNLVEVPFKLSPVRDRSCGGIKYYRIFYSDPTDDEDENIH
jgi:hypothetical protein